MQQSSRHIFQRIRQSLVPVYGEAEASSQAYWLMEERLGLSRTKILTDTKVDITEADESWLRSAIERLGKHEPIQHLLGKAWFLGRPFQVSPHVLIPRQETEELVLWIKENHPEEGLHVLDIGTGSGCIAISLALELKLPQVTGWDVSAEALETARNNVRRLGAEVTLKQADVLTLSPDRQKARREWQIIVSNPPYIAESEKAGMHANVLEYEPGLALFVPDRDPLLFYRKITKLAVQMLAPGGWLYFEINEAYGPQTADLMRSFGFRHVEIKKDLNSKDRMVRGSRFEVL